MFALLDMPDISQSNAHTMFDNCNRVLRNCKRSWKNVLHASQILVTLQLENAKIRKAEEISAQQVFDVVFPCHFFLVGKEASC